MRACEVRVCVCVSRVLMYKLARHRQYNYKSILCIETDLTPGYYGGCHGDLSQ